MTYEQQMKRDLELGKEWCRGKGYNFTRFKELVSRYVYIDGGLDEDTWVYLYNSYAEGQHKLKQSIREWCPFHFCDHTIERNGMCLKKNLPKNFKL